MNKFWNFTEAKNGERILRMDGVIASETWWGDEVTPAAFREELESGTGDITVYINSPGGDCVAASQIYTMLMDYPGQVTIKVDGMAASAASVIAMAGNQVLMAPAAVMMIHNPNTWAWGDSDEMRQAIVVLDEFKEAIINAYEIRTKLSRQKLSDLMDAETWMNAHKAIELGFADGILEPEQRETVENSFEFSRRAVTNSLLAKVLANKPAQPIHLPEHPKGQAIPSQPTGVSADWLDRRLNLLQHQI